MLPSILDYSEKCLPGWCIEKSNYDPSEEAYLESIFTLSNGYIGIRASLELASSGSEPGTYFAGVYDKLDNSVDNNLFGVSIKNKAITPSYAIAPSMNFVEVIVGGRSINFNNCIVKKFNRILDMQRGILLNTYVLEENNGRITEIKTMMVVFKSNSHLSMQKIEIIAKNYSDHITVRFIDHLDKNPQFIKRLKDYTSKTDLISMDGSDSYVYINCKVSETGLGISLVSKTLSSNYLIKTIEKEKNSIKEVFNGFAGIGQTFEFTKMNSFFTSRDSNEYFKKSFDTIVEFTSKSYAKELIQNHFDFYKETWDIADIEISDKSNSQIGLRWDIFNLIQLGPEHNMDVSISATGLHGQGYFGHIFWDTEIFMLPFYLATNPEIAKNLLLYRYHRLDAARALASQKGFLGAKFPWTSTSQGFDVTPPDWEGASDRAIHISGAVSYAFYNYYKWTKDKNFLNTYGIEVIVETAKFYASRVNRTEDGKYHLFDILGPDEYNRHADDNYYTNFLATWNIREALRLMNEIFQSEPDIFYSLCQKTHWDEKTKKLLVDVLKNFEKPQTIDGVNEQYNGFFKLVDSENIERNRYNMPVNKDYYYNKNTQILKQPDVIMMHFLFPDDFSNYEKMKSYEYYEKRCHHGSSLSPAIHCIVGNRLGFTKNTFGYFELTALMDLENLHLDKNIDDGIHMACAGGTWSAVIFGFAGVTISNDKLFIDPLLPTQLSGIKFSFLFSGSLFRVNIQKEKITIKMDYGESLIVNINGIDHAFSKGTEIMRNLNVIIED